MQVQERVREQERVHAQERVQVQVQERVREQEQVQVRVRVQCGCGRRPLFPYLGCARDTPARQNPGKLVFALADPCL